MTYSAVHEAAAQGFQASADAYERGRPDYPLEAIEFLFRHKVLKEGTAILDLGAGTGKLTRLLGPYTPALVAVEPSSAMRRKLLESKSSAKVFEGTAEKIPLPDGSVDGVVCAQSFHWFEGTSALKEIHRVLRPGGHLALLWNVRDEAIDWVARLTELIDPYGHGAPRYRTGRWRASFLETRLFGSLQANSFRHCQIGPAEHVVDRIASISFIASLPPGKRSMVLAQVRELLATHSMTRDLARVRLPYRTDLFWCERLGC